VRHFEEVLLKKATLFAMFMPTGLPIKALPLSIYKIKSVINQKINLNFKYLHPKSQGYYRLIRLKMPNISHLKRKKGFKLKLYVTLNDVSFEGCQNPKL
jgi:hypothetical protein